jgi:multiple sugar transport system permease protein
MKLQIKCKFIWQNRKLLFLLPSFLGVCVFVLLPFADVVRRSFTGAVGGGFQGLQNYVLVFQNQAFLLAVKNTFRFVAVCLPILIILSLFAAALLNRLVNTQVYKSAFLLPMAIPTATVVLIWKLLFDKQGLINSGLTAVGQNAIDFMGTDAAFWVLVVSYTWKNFGITVVLWLAGIYSVPLSIIEAAKVDGAGEWKCFFRIVLPNLKPVLYTITVFSFINSFKVFREAYLVAGSYPHESMYMMQHLFNNWFLNLDLDKMAAAAVCLTIVLTSVILVLSRLWDQED